MNDVEFNWVPIINLEYKNIPFFERLYYLTRTFNWYHKKSAQCTPNIKDKILCDKFLEEGVIKSGDVVIKERYGKFYILVKDESVLNAMRICH